MQQAPVADFGVSKMKSPSIALGVLDVNVPLLMVGVQPELQ
jgi:hypothetical protein